MTSIADRQLEQWKERMAPLGRLPKEWIGKTPDSMPPPTVRDRILRAWGGKCYRSGVELRPGMSWDADHVIAVADGGMNAERNLAPISKKAHKVKTIEENKARAAAAKQRRAATGNKAAPAAEIQSAGFTPRPAQEKASKAIVKKEITARPSRLDHLPRRGMFVEDK